MDTVSFAPPDVQSLELCVLAIDYFHDDHYPDYDPRFSGAPLQRRDGSVHSADFVYRKSPLNSHAI